MAEMKTLTVNGNTYEVTDAAARGHMANKSNPHGVTLAQIGAASNPNLLDNWYFADPINQRGQTEYSGAIYGIDRWKSISNPSKYALGKNGLIVSSGHFRHLQLIENADALVGKELTVSFLLSENTATTNIAIAEYVNGAQGTTKVTVKNKGTGCFSGTFSASEGFEGILIFNTSTFDGTAVITAVKLELGSQQTLARQENGLWVLNDPPPNKQQELVKCQRYFVGCNKDAWVMAHVAFRGYLMIEMPLSVPLRSSNVALVKDANKPLSVYCDSSWTDISSLGFTVQYTGTSLYLQCPKTAWEALANLSEGTSYLVKGLPDITVDL
jgi:hypothetical protein